MEHTNEALSYAIYMANKWNINECALVFNGTYNAGTESFKFSLAEHIWNKYMEYYDDYGMFGAPMKLLYELDDNNLKKLLDRACELYDGRENRKAIIAMKANEAPNKLYVDVRDNLSDSILYGFTEKRTDEDIEYIRADDLIKKVCEFFAPYIPDNSGGYERSAVIEDFKNYIKGE